MSDAEAAERLVSYRYFQAHINPVQLLNRATDPFVPPVRPHTLAVLADLDGRGLRNHVPGLRAAGRPPCRPGPRGISAYLEASSIRSRRVYGAYGYDACGGPIALPGGVMFPVVRQPRTAEDKEHHLAMTRASTSPGTWHLRCRAPSPSDPGRPETRGGAMTGSATAAAQSIVIGTSIQQNAGRQQ